MEPQLLIGWQQETVDLKQQVCRLQEQLAEGRAERQELEARCSALHERLCKSVAPSLVPQVEEEQRQFRKQMREGREREARQALLIHRLQNKVMEYRERCQCLEHQLLEHNHQINVEWRTRDEDWATLESALIQLEEEKQRSISLADKNNLLHEELSQSEQVILCLREDLKKKTSDWTTVVKEMGQRKSEHYLGLVDEQQSLFMSVWRSVVALKQHCQRLKTSTNRDLWKLRAEFFGISSSILSSCVSASYSLGLGLPKKMLSPTLFPTFPSSSTLLSCNLNLSPPDTSSGIHPLLTSSLGSLAARELEQHEKENDSVESKGEQLQDKMKQEEILELKHLHEEAVFQLNERISELIVEKEQQTERHSETESKLLSVSQGILKLSRILNSYSKTRNICFSDGSFSLNLSGMLSVLSNSESALQRMHEQLQRVELTVRQLAEENSALELCMKQQEADKEQLCTDAQHIQRELKHTLDMLSSERDTSSSLRQQIEEVLQQQNEVKREMDRLKTERARQDERKSQLETQIQKRTETEMLENVQLTERETLHCLEIHSLKGDLERQQFDMHRAEEEATDVRNALQESRKRVLDLSSLESVLRYELIEGQNCLDEMAVINSALLLDKRELNRQLLETEHELLDSQSQLELLRSEVSSLQTDVGNLKQDCGELRAHAKNETNVIYQLREKESEMEGIMEEKEKLLEFMMKERDKEKSQLEEVSSQRVIIYRQLTDVQQQLHTMTKEMKKQDGQEEEYQRENQRSKEELVNLERHNKHLEEELRELRSLLLPLQQQLSQQQRHLSEMEVDRIHMSRHIHTLQEAKQTLQGEMECLRCELEEETCKRKGENEHRQRSEEEKGVLLEEKQRLQEQLEELRRRGRQEEEEGNKDREKWKKEQEVLNEELGLRNEELASLRRHIEGHTKERERDMVKLIDLVNRTGEIRQMHEAETEMDRWKRMVEVVQEEINSLRAETSTLKEDRDKQNRLTEELQKERKENMRRKEEELKKLREEISRAEKDVKRLKELVVEIDLLTVDLNVARKECKDLKELLEQKEHSLEQQMSNVRKREEEVEELKKRLAVEQETVLKYQELKQNYKVTQVKMEQLEGSLQETQAILKEERRESGEKDIRMSLQAKELQEACALSREVTIKFREKEVAFNRLEKEIKEWWEKSEIIQKEAGELKHLMKDTKEEVLQLTATLQEQQEALRVKDKLEERVSEMGQELNKTCEALSKASEENMMWKKMEDEMKVMSVELRTKRNEVSALTVEVTKERKEKQEAKAELRRIQDVQTHKKEEEVQDVLKIRERLQEEERRSKSEMSSLQHELQQEQRENKKLQKELGKMTEEVTVLREEVKEEQRRGEELQEELTVVKEEVRKKKKKEQVDLLQKEQEGKHDHITLPEELINKRQELNALQRVLQKAQKGEELQAELQKKGETDHLNEELQTEKRRREEVQDELKRAQQNVEVLEANLRSLQMQGTHGTEDLEKSRDPLPLALDQKEADMIIYRQRTHLQEQSVKMETNPDQHVTDRLVVLQRFAAQLELQEKQLKKKNSQLESQNESLKRGRDSLRDTLRKVEEERSSFKSQLMEIKRFQKCTDTADEDQLRRKVRELEDQLSQLRHLLTEDHQQRAEFIQQSSQNSLSVLALRHNLTDSLAAVTRCPIPSVLESETQRLDCSLREEEFGMFPSKP